MTPCPRCQAANPETAAWCGQCYVPLGAEATPGAAATPEAPGPVEATPPGAHAGAAPSPAPADLPPSGGFRRRDGEVEWACVTCGAYNPLEQETGCAVCGTAMTDRFRTGPAGGGEDTTDWRAALGLSVLLPGGGHLLAGRTGTGVARAVLYVVWLAGGWVLTGSGAALVAVPLLLGALTVWGATLVDVANLPRRGPEILGGRMLLWLVVGVTILSLVGVVGSVLPSA